MRDSLEAIAAQFPHLPDIWGEGALFAFSGMDGVTTSRFVVSLEAGPFGLLLHTPVRRRVRISASPETAMRAVTGDVIAAESEKGAVIITWNAWHTIAGNLPAGDVRLETESGEPAREAGDFCLFTSGDDTIALLRRGDRFAISFGDTEMEARDRATAGVEVDIAALVMERLAVFRAAPRLEDARMDRLARKCLSVMKVNTLSPEGSITTPWSTPDRVPHEHMWLWDSVFHSLAMNRVDAELAWNFLKSVLDAQRPDGMIPHRIQTSGKVSDITQPPILAWGVWENFQVTGNHDHLAHALPRLERYLDWNSANRDRNGNGLLEWFIEGDPLCRSGESGLDNSPRFDAAALLDAVDFSTFQAMDMQYVAAIAAELGDHARADSWTGRAKKMTAQIHASLWDAEAGFYFDRDMEGHLSRVKAVTGFLPLLLDDIPAGRVACLTRLLMDPEHFNTALPIPSVAVSEPTWCTDMWRGATWINMNYLVIRGLQKQGALREAAWLRGKTISGVLEGYERFGVIFEFYDAKDATPPTECWRKGPPRPPYNLRTKMDSIRDYHWSAALTACLLWDAEE